jgi:hypothetical protein
MGMLLHLGNLNYKYQSVLVIATSNDVGLGIEEMKIDGPFVMLSIRKIP